MSDVLWGVLGALLVALVLVALVASSPRNNGAHGTGNLEDADNARERLRIMRADRQKRGGW